MKILIISDLHYETDWHRGIWEGDALSWLQQVIKRQQPTTLVGLGDWGHSWMPEDWQSITEMVETHAIYGNHDNMASLKGVRPAANGPHSHFNRVLVGDGETRNIEGLRFGFINGVVAMTHKVRDNVPRKTAEEYLDVARHLTNADVLCTHLRPEEIASRIRSIVQPRMWFFGHVSGPYKITTVGNTLEVLIDSSTTDKHFAILTHKGTTLEIWDDTRLVDQIDIPL